MRLVMLSYSIITLAYGQSITICHYRTRLDSYASILCEQMIIVSHG